MDFDSPEEKDFPGLYASEGADGKSKKSKEESDYSDGEHDKVSKKDLLIGRRKDKKDKDRGYAALEGESSSPEELLDAKSPSKSKKSKAFKFSTSKSKEKREKSRDKEKTEKTEKSGGDVKEEESTTKPKEKEKPDKDQKDLKKKDKERREKDKKDKSKDKDKKDKKLKQQPSVGVGGGVSEVLEFELGDVQPVFGVSISLATDRSRCHDGVDLPLVVRDCIDYLQEHALKSDHIYKVEPVRTRLQQYKRLYNNRERQPDTDELDTPTACGLLKLFLRELPEPVLTTDLIARFEELALQPLADDKQQNQLQELLELLPSCNRELLAWILLHFDAVLKNESSNKISSQSLAMLLAPPLQMSHRLLSLLFHHCTNLFGGDEQRLIKYVPPLTSSSPKLPDTPDDIEIELRKQESLLAQIHAEMNAGFVSKKREEQLWEVQRIITALKRKLRSFEKRQEKSLDESALTVSSGGGADTIDATSPRTSDKQLKLCYSDDESLKTAVATTESAETQADKKLLPETATAEHTADDEEAQAPVGDVGIATPPIEEQQGLGNGVINGLLYVDEDSGLIMLPKTHVDYAQLIRLQLENRELLAFKTQLQTRIGAERAEILGLKQLQIEEAAKILANDPPPTAGTEDNVTDGDYEKIINHFIRENTLLEHKKEILAKEIFEERRECIALQVELAIQQF